MLCVFGLHDQVLLLHTDEEINADMCTLLLVMLLYARAQPYTQMCLNGFERHSNPKETCMHTDTKKKAEYPEEKPFSNSFRTHPPTCTNPSSTTATSSQFCSAEHFRTWQQAVLKWVRALSKIAFPRKSTAALQVATTGNVQNPRAWQAQKVQPSHDSTGRTEFRSSSSRSRRTRECQKKEKPVANDRAAQLDNVRGSRIDVDYRWRDTRVGKRSLARHPLSGGFQPSTCRGLRSQMETASAAARVRCGGRGGEDNAAVS